MCTKGNSGKPGYVWSCKIESQNLDKILLTKQRATKRQKEKLAHEHGMQMATEDYIDSL